MFVVDPTVQHIQAGRDQIVTLVESINQPHVAVPGKPAQNAQAFVVGIRRPSGDFGLHVYLWLVQSQEAVVYSPEPRTVPLEDYREVELEALQFCESMGFMTEPVGFRTLAPEAQDELLSRLPPFREPARPAAPAPEAAPVARPVLASPVEPLPPPPAPAAGASPEQLERLVRFLGSF
jgi:hypothetical protein